MLKPNGRKLFSLAETSVIVFKAFRSAPAFVRARKSGMVSTVFQERLMLAVTEVNGCPMCTYAHTQMALESGMTAQEIEAMLAGTSADVPQEELPAILFAQHYAESRGKPHKESWERIVELYGKEKSLAILGAIRIIMMGNAYGIPIGAFQSRFTKNKEHADSRSTLPYELAIQLLFLPTAIVAGVLALLAGIVRVPAI